MTSEWNFSRAGGVQPLWTLAIILILALVLGACGKKEREFEEADSQTLYNNAYDFMVDGQYRIAAAAFDEVERQHPYSQWARRAQLMSAYAHYLSNQYDQTVIAAERFIALHPGSDYAAYAYYLIAQSYYEQINDVGRDQRMTDLAQRAFLTIIRRFPDTEYARDARIKLDLTRDHLAGKEMEVGRFYLQKGQELAAIIRFRNVIENYQTTSHAPEALHRLAECYMALGVVNEAQTAAAVLGYNYPNSEWYYDSFALLQGRGLRPQGDRKSWIARAFDTIF